MDAEVTSQAELVFRQDHSPNNEKKRFEMNTGTGEEKRQALVLLLLHYCAGLKHVEELDTNEKKQN